MRNKSKFTPHDDPTSHDEAIADESALLKDSGEESGDSSDRSKFIG
jgi:hypothetical protein